MARWKLTAKHYLKVPGNQWEYKEQDQATGRNISKRFDVPQFLDPEDKFDWTDRANQVIIVCNGNNPGLGDLIFEGPPTVDMEPLDDEAKAISDKERSKWRHPIEQEFIGNGGYSASLVNDLERQIDRLAAQGTSPVSLKGVDPVDFQKMQEQLAELMNQNAKLQEQVKSIRRV